MIEEQLLLMPNGGEGREVWTEFINFSQVKNKLFMTKKQRSHAKCPNTKNVKKRRGKISGAVKFIN